MDRTKIIDDYMSHYNKVAEKYKTDNIPALIENINSAISKSDAGSINLVYEKISEWNNLVSNVQGARDALVSYDKTLRLPSVKEFIIILDNITKEWRFNTEG